MPNDSRANGWNPCHDRNRLKNPKNKLQNFEILQYFKKEKKSFCSINLSSISIPMNKA